MDKARYKDFFLSSTNLGNDFSFIAKEKPFDECTFLIDGVLTFQAMEKTILEAKETIFLSFWIFNPKTSLQSRYSRQKGLRNWLHLLRYKLKEGVKIYIYLNDFDPILQYSLHSYAWKSFDLLRSLQLKSPKNAMEILVIRHEAFGRTYFMSEGFEKKLNHTLALLNKKKKHTARWYFKRSPGLWEYVEYNSKTSKYLSRKKSLVYYPASHHQKYCVVDNHIVIAGGLDVNSGRIDTTKHNFKKTAWHDVDVLIKGEIARDVARNFIGIWNHNRERFHSFLKTANKHATQDKISYSEVSVLKYIPSPSESKKEDKKKTSPKGMVQCMRTLSQAGWFSATSTVRDDILKNYQQAISKAEKYIYIENQYIRHVDLASWIINRCNQIKELVVIFVLPVAPEEVSNKGGADPVTNLGLYLQHNLLTKLKSALPANRFGAYSMVRKTRASKKRATDSYHSHQIYVHSKAMIIDDKFASIGSANTNGRSFLVDSEIALGIYSPSQVKKLRLKLWKELLGTSLSSRWKPEKFVDEWNKIAQRNKVIANRKGFIVPHDINRFPGKSHSLIPHKYAEVMDLEEDKNGDYLGDPTHELALS